MREFPMLSVLLSLCFTPIVAGAQNVTADDARSQWRVSCMIRHDRFDYVLPGAMRRNGIDMWIVTERGIEWLYPPQEKVRVIR